MNELQIFDNEQFGKIRAIGIDGNLWFIGKDVCEALGYQNPWDAIKKYVAEDDLAKYEVMDALGRKQKMTIINESGLYSLIFGSKLESAKEFKHWVTSEVLPSLRQSGSYSISDQAIPEASAGGVADLIRITRRVLLESGSTPQNVRQMTKEVYQTYHVQVPTPLQAPAQMNLLSSDYQLMLAD